jgi:hypothetical protein
MRTEIYVNTTLRQLDNHKCVPRGTPPHPLFPPPPPISPIDRIYYACLVREKKRKEKKQRKVRSADYSEHAK